MRSTFGNATVRLYFLDHESEGGAVETLFYGPPKRSPSPRRGARRTRP